MLKARCAIGAQARQRFDFYWLRPELAMKIKLRRQAKRSRHFVSFASNSAVFVIMTFS